MQYCNNKDLGKLLIAYQNTKDRKIANQIGKEFIRIADRFLRKANFKDYSEDRKNEMISDATYYMWRFIDRFDTSKDNPFSYFTTIAKNAFLQYLNERKKYNGMFTSIEYIEFFKNCDVSLIEE